MKHKASKTIALLLALTMAFALAACSSNDTPTATNPPASSSTTQSTTDSTSDTSSTQTETNAADTLTSEDVVPVRNLGGIEIVVSDWWTDNEAVEEPATNLREEEWREYRDGIFEQYGFTIKRKSTSGWGEYMELFTTSVMAQDPAADIFIMSDSWAMQLLAQGMLYPLNTLESLDLSNSKWNDKITELFTNKGNTYAITSEKFVEPRNFLFFNKRLFAEAGIDPEEPYNLQASGEWTWDKFMEYCAKLTRDTNNDGINDTYAIVGFDPEVYKGFVFGNDAQMIGRNDDGTFYNAMSDPNTLEALHFARSIVDKGYWCPSPEGAEWDWFVTGFHDAYAAMIIREAYSSSTWADMEDDWGMLLPPMGPKAKDYNTYFAENVYCLPFNISKEKAEDLMFAFDLYNEPLPYDLQNPDYWKDGAWGYQRFRDTRSVDDTLAMFYEGRYVPNNMNYVPGLDWGPLFEWGIVNGTDAISEKVESAKPVVDAAIEETNKNYR